MYLALKSDLSVVTAVSGAKLRYRVISIHLTHFRLVLLLKDSVLQI